MTTPTEIRVCRTGIVLAAVLSGGAVPAATAQTPRPDSATSLPSLEVHVTRTPTPLNQSDASITVVDSASLHRERLATPLDEALAFVPGVIAQNRWNYSVDERLAIRGFGSRANFGLRGVLVLIDGVPQTLPDGQSQLNNLDLATVDHVEVLRGGASSLYGNAAGGVVSFTTDLIPTAAWAWRVGAEGGSLGTHKEDMAGGGHLGNIGAGFALSAFSTDGFREQSAAKERRLNAGINWTVSPTTAVTARVSSADDPEAQNPGALTARELTINRDSASAGNILRGANKAVTQTQLAVGVTHTSGNVDFDLSLFGLTRNLDNPLATPAPDPTAADQGTWVGINRLLGGARATAAAHLGAVTLTVGGDGQALRDDRVNKLSVAGVATDSFLVNQRERVAEGGVFAQGTVALSPAVTLRAGIRRDMNHFSVTDHLLADGDASGARTMSATSGNGGVALQLAHGVTAWTDVSTEFDTPTTTELANRPDGGGGFNPDLDPERSVTGEVGVRATGHRLSTEGAIYRTSTHDAIVAYTEVDGRSYYQNAGHTRTLGAEATATFALSPSLALRGTWTHTDATFTDYKVVNGGTTDTLDGNRLAGVPRDIGRVGILGTFAHRWTVDVDQAFSSSMWGDDDNTLFVAGWGAGVTSIRAAWHGDIGAMTIAPSAGLLNAFGRNYVGSVTINGTGGRVYEPAAGRTLFVAVTVGRTSTR